MLNKRGFASDNNSGVHPKILKRFEEINNGHTIGYGDDIYTQEAIEIIKKNFGQQTEVFFVYNGTAANTLALKAITHSYNSIICAETSHMNVDECGAPEKFTGCKLLSLSTDNGKLTIEKIKYHLHDFGFEHHAQPKVISITQTTELGTVYTIKEIKKITSYAHKNGLLVHMDGARLYNAAVSLNVSLQEITSDAGIDVLSFGSTKNGGMFGEAILFFDKKLAENFKYYRKQGMQLHSKMRYLSSQFAVMLTDELWRKNAAHANKMAKVLYEKVKKIPEITVTQKVETNGIFAIIPEDIIEKLQSEYFFYIWDEAKSEVRWMTSFDTTENDIANFVDKLINLLRKTLINSKVI
ncbi:MAG: low specificity L-threonine aldolase [Candidatus Cloacimonetes bacterium]|nr:low specificity L-threonine aldolase [Candidatus Cloacimonadota bacterium]